MGGNDTYSSPTRQVNASELRQGMTIVAMPPAWADIAPHNGRWPTITDEPSRLECGEDGQPTIYWTTDAPGPERDLWAWPDTKITIAQ